MTTQPTMTTRRTPRKPQVTLVDLLDPVAISIGASELQSRREFQAMLHEGAQLVEVAKRIYYTPENAWQRASSTDWQRAARRAINTMQVLGVLSSQFEGQTL